VKPDEIDFATCFSTTRPLTLALDWE
jgi:hypothetical protein